MSSYKIVFSIILVSVIIFALFGGNVKKATGQIYHYVVNLGTVNKEDLEDSAVPPGGWDYTGEDSIRIFGLDK